jgi:putative acetyltransferase
MQQLTFHIDDPASPAAAQLLEQLDSYLTALYPPESMDILSATELRQPNVVFLTARLDDQAVGCGAVVKHSNGFAEIKRLFVRPGFRGWQIGRRILAHLETFARESGFAVMRLETGVHQPEALQLYLKAGYRRRVPFGKYAADPLSVCMEKALA